MARKFLKIISAVLLVYLVVMLVSCVVIPAFQKKTVFPFFVREAAPTSENWERVHCVDDNNEALVRRLQVIESAERELIFATYNFMDDESGRDVMAALQNASDRGVKVRVLVDGICASSGLRKSDRFIALSSEPNVEVRVYNPVNVMLPWRLNYRMHDKYIVADDDLYILGGRNTKNVSLGAYQDKKDIDRDLVVYTEDAQSYHSVNQVKNYFESVWSLDTTKPFSGSRAVSEPVRQELRDYYSYISREAPDVFRIPDWKQLTVQTDGIYLLTNPIEAENKEPILWTALTNLMASGKDVLVQTPYIICNNRMYEDLESLSEGGSRVRVITNAVETGANPCGCADYLNQKKRILKTGTEVYECVGDQSCHTKTVLIDDRISIVGSFNMDMRSAYLDTEMMLVIDCPELNAHLRQMDETYMQMSRRNLPDGTVTLGELYAAPPKSAVRNILYGFLRLMILPFRQLL